MTQSNHTPGPWEVSPKDECRVNVAMNSFLDPNEPRVATKEESEDDDSFHDDWNICQTDGDHYSRSHDECIANARLIASVPKLLAAVQGLLWPNVPSADDVALMVRMCGNISSQEAAMELVEQLRLAQAVARAAIAEALGAT